MGTTAYGEWLEWLGHAVALHIPQHHSRQLADFALHTASSPAGS